VANHRLSLGLVVLLVGVWYCYKRGREERLKAESGKSPEVPAEDMNQQEVSVADHSDGVGI
jgi:hypothetical protein